MKSFDYNLLKVLRVLIDTQNTRQASEVLNLSQSAVSHALSRLRDSFDDPLFVRERYGLVPTERCLEIEKSLPALVEQIDSLFQAPQSFEPQHYNGKVSISLTNALTNSIGVKLYRELSERAPNAQFEIMDWTWQVESGLLSRKVHVALDYGPESYSKQIRQKLMPKSQYVVCVRERHPLTKLTSIELSDLARYPLALIRTPDWRSRHETAEQTFIRAGYVPNVILKSDSPLVNFEAIRNSDAIFPMVRSADPLPAGITSVESIHNSPEYNMDIYAYDLHQTKDFALNSWLVREIESILKGTF
ncbi:LysR family transcriptional regulator [Vibrio sp. D404a]|uniref:LysR family transcriptional regulator n=1 Tax=unclassified Vibrio TaxID=2614977 RepID=UPI002555C937|nr:MULTISPECIES: LysR family transcriptional regulator [unclassified Vibrio]MDK9736041.1 LysR family transcriptional regulator [Vibrio sp. D404a]MDK9797793.1 LysR family transcriptional regulator [Vibrio sp. D449a]